MGAEPKRSVDFRVVAAAQNDLAVNVRNGLFRRDLRERLAGVVIRLTPLRERAADIVPLATHFAARRARRIGPGAGELLSRYEWPGNVRQLRLLIERAAHSVKGDAIDTDLIAELIEDARSDEIGANFIGSIERRELMEACSAAEGDWRRAALAMDMSRATFYRRLRAYGVDIRSYLPKREFLRTVENR